MNNINPRTGCEPIEKTAERFEQHKPLMGKDDKRRARATLKALRTGKGWKS